ncbi:hypothetical protein AK812_SmicGene3434 [Symbiodinium microadriaticum]|uniref:DUF4116 domain-containing protein n=1 Tax=Symbiodinium microadriaticum TaxID=2951 RepID=A0A1Q9EYU0_SYMMI|nr:hypothetical protein AK812_SmicGene3434 [Symbiodinium microadriaticum]
MPGQPPRGGAAVSAEVPQAPQENMHDGNICADDEEYFEDLCYLKCSLATKGTHPIRTSAFTCCKSEPCSFDNTEINMSPCDGFDVSGNLHGQHSACPHGEGTCLEDEELLLGMCYKKCSILTDGRFNHRVAATTCCSETGLACFNPMNLKTDFVGFAVGGGKGDGSQATPSVPHLPMKELTEKGWKAPKQEVPTAVPVQLPEGCMANHVHMLILRVSKPSQFVGDWVRDWLGNRQFGCAPQSRRSGFSAMALRALPALLCLAVLAQVCQWILPAFVTGAPAPAERTPSVAMRSRRFRKRDIEAFMTPSKMQQASEMECDSEEFVSEAIVGDPRGFAHASERLRSDRDFVKKMVRVNPRVVDFMDEDLFADEEFIEELKWELQSAGFGGPQIYGFKAAHGFWGRGRRHPAMMRPRATKRWLRLKKEMMEENS